MTLTNLQNGLSKSDVEQRINNKQTNITFDRLTRSTSQIISENLFTLFNIVNLVIAILIALTGSFNNLFFLGPVVLNTLFGTYQEIKAKRTIDKIMLVNEKKIKVLRDGIFKEFTKENLVLDDIIQLERGQQIPADGIIRETSGFEVDESSLTGESNSISKKINDEVFSGSLVVGGSALVQLTKVGNDSFISKLSLEIKSEKRKVSILLKIINNIIKFLTYALIPLGTILFVSSFTKNHDFNQSILGMSASVIGMIPQGLVLLTSVALTVGAMHLTKKKVLVRSLSSIETLARVNVLCLDKTGTITTGNLKIKKIIPKSNISEEDLIRIAKTVIAATKDGNQTATAIKNYTDVGQLLDFSSAIPFSSEKKYSGFKDNANNEYLIGALEFIIPDIEPEISDEINEYAKKGNRVIAITKNKELLGLLLIVDELRKEAKDTFSYLERQQITLKIISGDNPLTVSNVAQQAKIKNTDQLIDMSTVGENPDYQKLVNDYTVFGRVSPDQKKNLVNAMQEQGLTVGMTGDGVNDVLAMKQADCSIAVAGGSDAAESTADFVLLNKNFDSMIFVLNEGRRVINNVERVSALYLIKTMYSVALTIMFIFLRTGFPVHPAQLTPINALIVGIPTFFLALEPDYRPPAGKFLKNVMLVALPAALEIVGWVMVVMLIGNLFDLSFDTTSTLVALAIACVGFTALVEISFPLNRGKLIIFSVLAVITVLVFMFSGKVFELNNPFVLPTILFTLPIILSTFSIFKVLQTGVRIFWNNRENKKDR